MKTLSAKEVKIKLQKRPEIYLVMTLKPEAFQKQHIPGSLNIYSAETALKLFSKEDEIIVYCSDVNCMASYYAYQQLEAAGFRKIWRFAGGLREWAEHGFALSVEA